MLLETARRRLEIALGGAASQTLAHIDPLDERAVRGPERLYELVDGYYVGDVDEFDIVRRLTRKPIATLLNVSIGGVRSVIDRGGIATISSGSASSDVADAWARDDGRIERTIRNAR